MLGKVWELHQKYNFDGYPDRIYVDDAHPSFIRSLKLLLGRREDYEKVIDITGPQLGFGVARKSILHKCLEDRKYRR